MKYTPNIIYRSSHMFIEQIIYDFFFVCNRVFVLRGLFRTDWYSFVFANAVVSDKEGTLIYDSSLGQHRPLKALR